MRYDSLRRDSAFVITSAHAIAEVDAVLHRMRKDDASKHYAALKMAYNNMSAVDDFSSFNLELSSFMQELAVEMNDYAMAYTLQNLLFSAMNDELRAKHAAELDSLGAVQKELLDEKSKQASEYSTLKSDSDMLKVIGGVGIAALLVAIAVLVVLMGKSKRKLSIALQQAGDTSEKEALVMKLEAARNEVNALKVAARKQVEVPAVSAPKPEAVAPSSSFDATMVTQWNDEIQQGLAKIKAHCESGKNGMSVPTYMAIINDTTRLSSQMLKRATELANSKTSK
jgi:hypothetical protein